MQSDLAHYGIPAKVTTGSFCSSDPAPAGFAQAVSLQGSGTWRAGSATQPTITIDPSAMPAGTELSLGDFQLSTGERQADFALVNTSSYTCSTTPSGPGGPPDGLGVLYGGPGPAGS